MLGAINYNELLKIGEKVVPMVQGKLRTGIFSTVVSGIGGVLSAEFLDASTLVFNYFDNVTRYLYKKNLTGNDYALPTNISSSVFTATPNGMNADVTRLSG